jgi:hypothetical protein
MTIKGLEAKVIAKNSKIAEIEIEGQKITLPSEYLPASVEIGESLNLYLTNSQEGILQEKKLAKAILEEILNGQ